ncbi:MAG: DUF3806 domain-containing protein, partial [Halioglobus sp.]|nr:DUF3806 domain-containing protein [Halioglobus sp.]
VILGEHLARDLDMHWVTYADKLGRSRALRYRDSDTFLFPITMISRRREVDNTATVREIYDRAYAIVDRQRPQLPFSASP